MKLWLLNTLAETRYTLYATLYTLHRVYSALSNIKVFYNLIDFVAIM